MLNETVRLVTDRVVERSAATRGPYLKRMRALAAEGPRRAHLTCGNLAHAYAASPDGDKAALNTGAAGNIGIVTAYNDMLSAHQPFEHFPDIIRDAARVAGGTAQVAGGVPAMCDGVTQGQPGMELSLFSRDVIAMAAGVALSHNVFDASIYLGVCDKIVPGLVVAAGAFGYLPAVFVPAGPMPSGIANDEKARVRQQFAAGEVGRDRLMEAEMASYHGPGTCTFYGTANTNQMLMEFMGLHLPGSSFVNPNTPMRTALTRYATKRALAISALGSDFRPAAELLDERAFVNGIVGLNATGGSTNLVIHLIAMARAFGIVLDWQDLSDLSDVVPLLARVYPNGLADVNHFHAAGGLGFTIGELLRAGLLHPDARTIMGDGIEHYTREPVLEGDEVTWRAGASNTLNRKILRPVSEPFQANGGLKCLHGSLGTGVMKVSAVKPERQVIEAPVAIFSEQADVKAAFQAGKLDRDVIVVVRYQGPKANGMPELHKLTPPLGVLQDRGYKVALVTDGRMSGASGKVPAAIHVTPEAVEKGGIAKLRDGDVVRLDAVNGTLNALVDSAEWDARPAETADLSLNQFGMGTELFANFRAIVSGADTGASVLG